MTLAKMKKVDLARKGDNGSPIDILFNRGVDLSKMDLAVRNLLQVRSGDYMHAYSHLIYLIGQNLLSMKMRNLMGLTT